MRSYLELQGNFENRTRTIVIRSRENTSIDGRILHHSGRRIPFGKAAYFIRIGGCDVGCHWCDVKESWNADLHPATDVNVIVENASKFPAKAVVVTGGEPSIYNLNYITEQFKSKGIDTFIETSGAYPLTGTWDWVCLSPKKTSPPLPENFSKGK
jgi:organic radical activating enzyme